MTPFPLRWLWGLTGLLAVIIVGWCLASARMMAAPGLVALFVFEGMMLGLAFFYSRYRPDERLAALAHTTAAFFAYSTCMGVFSFAVATLARPLIDAPLDRFDKMTGFDWMALHAFVFGHAWIRELFIVAYNSVIPQVGLLLVFLITTKRYARLASFLRLYAASSLSFIALSGLFPAVGAFGTYHIAEATPYVQQFLALRSGSMPVPDLFSMQGVVQFPSFHLALALLGSYAVRGVRYLSQVILFWNAIVIAATPSVGGHFMADLWAGAFLMGLWIAWDRRWWPQDE